MNYDIEEKILNFVRNNLNNLKLFFIIFAVNIIIYGQKIFFYSLATDDYTRFYMNDTELFLTRMAGRWAQDLLNIYVFADKLHILPYFHGIIGVLSFTLAGFLTARYLNRHTPFETIIITLLISATPMLAHNLFFNTNITAWITLLLGIMGFLMFYKSSLLIKFLGFSFVVIAISSYQPVMQVIMAMVIFKSILDVLEIQNKKEIKKIFLNFVWAMLFVLLAYGISVLVNELIIHFGNLEVGYRYQIASNNSSISIYFDRLFQMYSRGIDFFYFSTQFKLLYLIMTGLSLLGVLVIIIYQPINRITKITKLLLLILLFLSIPIVVNMPFITGIGSPIRAQYVVGWVIAGLFAIQLFTLRGILKTFSTLIAIAIIIVSSYYINVFFDTAHRQTNADIIRANQIVTRIRNNINYTKEPIEFMIIGDKEFPVTGQKSYQQALARYWSKYEVFKYYTDFKFEIMTDKSYDEIKPYIIKQGKKIVTYPAKNSIIFVKNKVILFLNTDTMKEINMKIYNNQFLKNKSAMTPIAKSFFDMYLDKDENKLIYYKSPCNQDDTSHWFFTLIYSDQIEGYKNMGSWFKDSIKNNECIKVVDLPNIDITTIKAGQYIPKSGKVWELTIEPGNKQE